MTIILDVEFEVSPDNTTLTEANTGYTNISTPGTLVSDNSMAYVGTFCAQCTLVAQTLTMRKDVATSSVGSNALAFRADALPTTNNSAILQYLSTGTSRAGARILTDGTFQLRQASSAVWDSVTNGNGSKFQVDRWYWIEHLITATTQRLIVYDDGQNLLEDSGNIAYSGSTWNQVVAGSANANTWVPRYDRHIITDQTIPTGPRVVNTDWVRSDDDDLGLTDAGITVALVQFLFQFDFDTALVNGANITTGVSGYDNVTNWVSDNSINYNLLGTKSGRINLTAQTGLALKTFLVQANVYNGIAFNFNTLPDVTTAVLQVRDINGTVLASMRILAGGQINLRDGVSGVWTSTPAQVISQIGLNRKWYWFEHSVQADNSRQKAQVFDYAGNLLVDSDWQTYTGGGIYQAQAGIASASTVDVNVDRHRVGIVAPVGPIAQPGDFAQFKADSLDLSDTFVADEFRTLNDLVGLQDSNLSANLVIGNQTYAQTVNNEEVLTDAASLSAGQARTINNDMQLLENDLLVQNTFEVLNDSLGLTDSIAATQGNINRTVDTSEDLTDSLIADESKVLTDNMGLTESPSVLTGVTIPVSRTETEDLTDSVTTDLQRGLLVLDSMGLAEGLSVGYFSLTPTVNDTLGITGTNLFATKNGVPVGSLSMQDQVYAALIIRGYSGTIQDMQYAFLKDQYILQFGSLPTGYTMSSADFQRALGKHIEELLDLTQFGANWVVTVNHNINPTDAISRLQGQFEPKVLRSAATTTVGSIPSTTCPNTPGRKVYVAIAMVDAIEAVAAPATFTGWGVTWTKILDISTGNARVNLSLWEAETTGGATGGFTLTHGLTPDGMCYCIFDAVGIKSAGNGLQEAIVSAVNATTTPSVTLGGSAANGNVVIGLIAYNASNAQSISVGANHVILANIVSGTDAVQLAVEYDVVNPLTNVAGWTTTNASTKVVAIAELEAA